MKIILDHLKVKYNGPMKLFCDNNSNIDIIHNPIQHDKIKHTKIGRHFIKENLDNGLIVTSRWLIHECSTNYEVYGHLAWIIQLIVEEVLSIPRSLFIGSPK
ncbi:hypothetical protein CR513_59698, partial [Mucuna pruriens]